jgi:hypothetical protein
LHPIDVVRALLLCVWTFCVFICGFVEQINPFVGKMFLKLIYCSQINFKLELDLLCNDHCSFTNSNLIMLEQEPNIFQNGVGFINHPLTIPFILLHCCHHLNIVVYILDMWPRLNNQNFPSFAFQLWKMNKPWHGMINESLAWTIPLKFICLNTHGYL